MRGMVLGYSSRKGGGGLTLIPAGNVLTGVDKATAGMARDDYATNTQPMRS